MDELISRQAAIDEIKEIYEWHDNVTKERIIEHFKQLPPANNSEIPNSSDCISRQAAIDAINKYWNGISDRHKTLDGEMAVYADCKRIVKQLPSVQPEPQWIPVTERLPGNDGMYYVTITRMGGIDAVPCIWYDKKWAIGGAEVIAWIAIPEPYRAERREDE